MRTASENKGWGSSHSRSWQSGESSFSIKPTYQESIEELLQDEALLRRVLQREPSLVSRIVGHAGFLNALFSQPEAFRGLLQTSPMPDNYHLDQLLASVGRNAASLSANLDKEEAELLQLLSDAESLELLLQQQPKLAAAVAANPAFVEQVKVRRPQCYRALLEKAEERFSKDLELAMEARAERETLEVFTTEGGKAERESERIRRDAGVRLLEGAMRGEDNVVRVLLEAGADPNLQNEDSRTALMEAAYAGHSGTVRLLLDGGADPNLQNENGWTALMEAARAGHPAIVRSLLKRGSDPNLPSYSGWTALMDVAKTGHLVILRLLLNGGADPNLQNKNGQTARSIAGTRRIAEMLESVERKWGRQGGVGQERRR